MVRRGVVGVAMLWVEVLCDAIFKVGYHDLHYFFGYCCRFRAVGRKLGNSSWVYVQVRKAAWQQLEAGGVEESVA